MKPSTPKTELPPSTQPRTGDLGHAPEKAALLLFSVAVLLAGGEEVVRGQTVLDDFDANADGAVQVVVVQPDGKILIGGDFTTLSPNGGATVTRNGIARLNPDGTLDTTFNPSANGSVRAIAVQPDGKILVGGLFNGTNSIGGANRNYIARLDATNGLADSFNPNANLYVFSIVVQADGRILVGGGFNGTNSIGGATRNGIARLDATNGLADSFNPNANNAVSAIAVQTNGWILVGGGFGGTTNSIGGAMRNHIARLNPTNGLADSFDPNASGLVDAIVVQPDGKILAGGTFAAIGGQLRPCIARLDATNGLADSFNPSANEQVYSIAVQADGKIVAGGLFYGANSIGGQSRNCIARLDATTGLADSFDPSANFVVYSVAVQADGKVLAGGYFNTLSPDGGPAVDRYHIARLTSVAATPRPLLNIQRSANTNVVLSWATNFTGFTLEANTNLNTIVWSVVSPASVVSGTNNVVTNAASGSARFYRLRK